MVSTLLACDMGVLEWYAPPLWISNAKRQAKLLDTLAPLLQIFLDSLYFLFEGGCGFHQFRGFLRILRTRSIHLFPQLGRGIRELPYRFFCLLDLIDWTLHPAPIPSAKMIS